MDTAEARGRSHSSGSTRAGRRGGLALGHLSGVLGFHLRLASAVIYRDFTVSLAALELTQKQFAVLELVSGNRGVAQADLARALGTDRATMMALVDRLEGRGLLQRRPSAADGRRKALALTASGEALLERARQAITAHEQRFVNRFTPVELAALIDGLARIYADAPPDTEIDD